jgi:hypothetical protein
MLKFNDNKVIKRNDLYYALDFELFKILMGKEYLSDINYEKSKELKDNLARKLFYFNKLEINGFIVASQNKNDLKWIENYFFNVRIRKGFINTKRYYFINYGGNYAVFKDYCNNNGLDYFNENYDIHVNHMINDKNKFLKALELKKGNYYIKHFDKK